MYQTTLTGVQRRYDGRGGTQENRNNYNGHQKPMNPFGGLKKGNGRWPGNTRLRFGILPRWGGKWGNNECNKKNCEERNLLPKKEQKKKASTLGMCLIVWQPRKTWQTGNQKRDKDLRESQRKWKKSSRGRILFIVLVQCCFWITMSVFLYFLSGAPLVLANEVTLTLCDAVAL